MKILVTGGAGFIGSHLVDALVLEGHQVIVLDNFDPQVHEGKKPDYLNPKVEYVEGDVRDREALRKVLKGVDLVYHEAAAVGVGQSMYEIEKYVSANCLGTSILLDVIVNDKIPLKKFIVASSMSIYGEGQYRTEDGRAIYPTLREEAQMAAGDWEMRDPDTGKLAKQDLTPESKPLMPTSVYAVSKRDQEELCLSVGRSYKIPTVALRYFNVYGPRQALSNPYTGVCAIFSARIKNGNSPLVYEDGAQTRDFVNVQDIVQANLIAMKNPGADYQALNVGTGQATSIAQIGVILAELYGADVKPQIAEQFRAGDIRHCVADASKLTALGFKPTTTLKEGLENLVKWGQTVEAEDRVADAAKELERRGLATGRPGIKAS